jgi:sugar-specific transcriptional regulator TrmB
MTDVIKHLMRLGLSEYEARAYVATVALGEGTVNEISKESGVPRSRAYDIMERLAAKGFVEMGNTTPICYRANDPMTASERLMEEVRHANEEILKGLREAGKKAEKIDNPVWTLTGDWAIERKIEDLLDTARKEVSFVFLSRGSLHRYSGLIAKRSSKKRITVAVAHRPEDYVGHLGSARVMRLLPIPSILNEVEGTLCDRGFVTGDGRYCIEMIMVVDQDTTMLLTNEAKSYRAIIIQGTVLNLFGHDAVRKLIEGAEEVSAGRA